MKRSTEIEDAFKEYCKRRSQGEPSNYEHVFSDDMKLLIGSRPEQWWDDPQIIKNAFGSEGITLVPSNPIGYSHGDLGRVIWQNHG